MLFVGDRLDERGNDYRVAMGVACQAVDSWEDTAEFLEALIPTLSGQPSGAESHLARDGGDFADSSLWITFPRVGLFYCEMYGEHPAQRHRGGARRADRGRWRALS